MKLSKLKETHFSKYLKATLIFPFLLCSTGCFYDSAGEMIYIVSRAVGSPGKMAIPDSKLQVILAQTVFRTHRSTLNILNVQQDESELRLSRLTLGLQLEFEVGINNVAKVAAEKTIELRFERLPAP
jgi:hypothetical protein